MSDSEWHGGKFVFNPIEYKNHLYGKVTINKKTHIQYFHWGEEDEHNTKEDAYTSCMLWFYQLHKENGTLRNEYREIDGNRLEVKLTQGLNMIVDKEDENLVKDIFWCAHKGHNTYYAEGSVKGSQEKFHRVMNNFKRVKHIDGNGLNNTRRNLCDGSVGLIRNGEPVSVSTKVRGIAWRSKKNAWVVPWIDHKKKHNRFFSVYRYGNEANALDQARIFQTDLMKRIKDMNMV